MEENNPLQPFLEIPNEIFQEVDEQYEMACGRFGTITTITTEYVVFRNWVKGPQNVESLVGNFRRLVGENNTMRDGETVVVSSEEKALTMESPATWYVREGINTAYIYESVPFSEPVKTPEQLQEELENIMYQSPDLSHIFEIVG